MESSRDCLVASRPLRFNLKHLLIATAAVGVIIAPTQWFGGAYLFSAVLSAALIVACTHAYRNIHVGAAFGLAVAVAIASLPFAVLLLIFCLHAMANAALCLVFAAIPNRPRVFAVAASFVAVGVYGLSMSNAWERQRELAQLRTKYPFISLASRLEFEKSNLVKPTKTDKPPQLSPAVLARLTALDAHQQQYDWPRAWALRELHENSYRHFARAAGFGVMRMPSLREELIELKPRQQFMIPSRISTLSADAPTAELNHVHTTVVEDFVDPNEIGYARDRSSAAGFSSHGLSSGALHDGCCGVDNQSWQVVRLELVSLLRHDEPRVYVAASMPAMDELEEVPTRPPNEFERGALSKIASQEDIVVDHTADRIQMMGAVRAGSTCLTCHDGPRGRLLGAFSYEISPVSRNFQSSTDTAQLTRTATGL